MHIVTEFRSLPRNGKLYLANQVLQSFFFTWPIFFGFMTQRFTLADGGLYLTVLTLSQILCEIPTGYLADKIGEKGIVISGYLLRAFSLGILFVGIDGHLLPVMSGLLYGVGSACISGALDSLLYKTVTHKDFEKVLHLEVPLYQIGLVCSAFLGGLAYGVRDYLPFLMQAVFVSISILPVYLMSTAIVTTGAEDKISLRSSWLALRKIVSSTRSLMFIASFGLYVVFMDFFVDILVENRMIELAFSPESRGAVISAIKFSFIVFNAFYLMKHARSIRAKSMYMMASLTLLPLLITSSSSQPLFVVLYFFTNFMTTPRGAILGPITQSLVSNRTRATESSMYSFIFGVIYVVIAPVVTYLIARWSTAPVLLLVSMCSLLLVVPFGLKTLRWYEATNK